MAELQLQNQQTQLRLAEEQARLVRQQQRQLAQIRSQATVNHRGQDSENGLEALARGQRLSDKALRQLDHAVDLVKFSTRDSTERAGAEALRDQIRLALAQNDFVRHLEETSQTLDDQTFEYRGETFDMADGVPVMLKEHETFTDKGCFMTQREVQKLATLILTPLDHTLDGAVQPTSQKAGTINILSPQDAYNLVQSGNQGSIKTKAVSKWYKWEDVLWTSTTINNVNRKSVSLSVYKNALKFSLALDKVCDRLGQKVPIESWVRIQKTSSNHKLGLAVDLKGSKSFLHGPVYNAIRRTPEIKGIGQSQPNWPIVGLHIDNGNGHLPPTGHQHWFIDNPGGTHYGSPINLKVEPSGSTRVLGYRQ